MLIEHQRSCTAWQATAEQGGFFSFPVIYGGRRSLGWTQSSHEQKDTQTSIVSNANWHIWSRPARHIFFNSWACRVCWIRCGLHSHLDWAVGIDSRARSPLSLSGRLNCKNHNTAREVKASHIVYNSVKVWGDFFFFFFFSFLEEKHLVSISGRSHGVGEHLGL